MDVSEMTDEELDAYADIVRGEAERELEAEHGYPKPFKKNTRKIGFRS